MTHQGNNIDFTVYRATQLADDVAGGSQRTPYYQIATCRGRLSNRRPTLEMRAQGLGTDRLFDAALQPATVDVAENDMIIPANGKYAHVRFLVTGVQTASVEAESSPRAHLRLQIERWDDGKMVELI